ncbi:hypothetical protein SERLA73DRAFT_181573 [Serpula lacrymans var. lacrymans S7.3]|uniref:Thioredoxin-like fold domain-containing protein n=2 Tax=Serpula lacrymans var. lacrymans TaxID=341189 RepID=F8PYA9_SERL3|nr:uncharacterized protein SERLADRAFT_467835 [Serpula lacrymans var. lacrymans S7.9]EGN98872.1 hypothetical protein SERLA73DRAFT_181573 [Serpula lacrymans var. lacrymans S7.3]EGO24468.1 hypothetical protein SERLADRAFT_467835 [Serpula lacrymans var. lacrymans S7.9]
MASETKVILWGFGKDSKVPSPSAFCQKMETFLRFTSTPYEFRATSSSKAPKHKLPYVDIHHDGKVVTIADSHFIIRYLIENGISSDPDSEASLTSVQKAESRAFQGYLEEVVYPAIAYEKWFDDTNFATMMSEVPGVAAIPWIIKPLVVKWVRRSVQKSLWNAGVGRHSRDEARMLENEGFGALDARLSLHPYFHGDKATLIDIMIAGLLTSTLGTKANPYFYDMVVKSPILISFCRRMSVPLFPEYEQVILDIENAEKEQGKNEDAVETSSS